MKKQIVLLVISLIFLSSCSKTKVEYQKGEEPERKMATEVKAVVEEGLLEDETVFTTELIADTDNAVAAKCKYGELYITYELSKEKVLSYGEYKHNVLNRTIFYKNNGKDIILGTITMEGVFDKDGKQIAKQPFYGSSTDAVSYCAGYDLDVFINNKDFGTEFALNTNLFLYYNDYNSIGSSEVYAFLKIDTKNDTLAIIENPF